MENESKAISKASVLKATGRTWAGWFSLLDECGADKLAHKEMAFVLQRDHGVSGWWAQTITVEYERRIGRREIGQTSTGKFQASVTKTLKGTMDQILRHWQAFMKNETELNGVLIKDDPIITDSPKWRYWRVQLNDGSKITIVINQKDDEKVLLAVNHENLSNAESIAHWKSFWKARLSEFSNRDL